MSMSSWSRGREEEVACDASSGQRPRGPKLCSSGALRAQALGPSRERLSVLDSVERVNRLPGSGVCVNCMRCGKVYDCPG